MSDSSQPRGLQHARLPYPSPSSRICPSSCPLSQWCHPTTSSSAFSLQSFPISGSFPISLLFASCGQRIVAAAAASVLPMSVQGWFPLRLTGVNPCCPGTKSLQHHSWKASVLQCSAFFMVQLSQIRQTCIKNRTWPQFFFFLAALCHIWDLSSLPR